MKRKIIYEDEENNILFFNPQDYLDRFGKSIIRQMNKHEFAVQRNICISIPSGTVELLRLINSRPKKKTFYKVLLSRGNGDSTRWALDDFKAREIGKDNTFMFDRIFIEKYTLFNKRRERKDTKEVEKNK